MIFIIGGARSGKSSFAEKKALEIQETIQGNVVYLATSIVFDEDTKNRVEMHQSSRPSTWKTIEQYKSFQALQEHEDFMGNKIILLDCLTLMITNLLLEEEDDFDTVSNERIRDIEQKIKEEIESLIMVCRSHNKILLVVSNEVGFGIVPAYRLGSIFRDIAGRMNQYIASLADDVYLITAGIPLKIK
ncbi:bifunctional adenosylcobinamide kinase/adenosylcobinamide-phosphate guanylyltransferase [Bacillus sp. RG28]|uniref:Adenosylcobinamide kinase n=1 Tax=Gottfriedia endophytica TaxID=2820819 RepID=A0A940NN25_9BACI|nr:bifunctional adenosylcobinamide kinase/adenosylcobinamide-phosphate guanylyltransferase [Gottfriedia endophytica]MBP0724448.1 bifunctional adenosylcobinamide kinase/adenosylcobinamide-phosphate guanylyltransferase [Gottfriedia endophytica]